MKKKNNIKTVLISHENKYNSIKPTFDKIKDTTTISLDIIKNNIIKKFNKNVKNKEINLENQNKKHSGKEGYWLERQMEIKHNCNNTPDIDGYEMKKYSTKKITLGDFSASEYIFSPKNKRDTINGYNNWNDDINISRKQFIYYFGNPNKKKNNRYSWSGSCIPKYNIWNYNGQILQVLHNKDIVIYYSFSHDEREIKNTLTFILSQSEIFKKDNILIAIWKNEKMKMHINMKFNQNGFFICKKTENKYDKICFGKPFDFEYFIECIQNNKIIFDSGMYAGNKRNYSHFRGTYFWNELIIEEY